jgi:general secretion pathway protein D
MKKETERLAASEREGSTDIARSKIRQEVGNALPALSPRSLEGLDLNFSHKTELKEIFKHLSKNSGVNIVMHSSIIDQSMPVSVNLQGLSFQCLLDVLMMQSNLFYKVLDSNSIMVFKKDDSLEKEYGQRLLQTFYLSNVVAKNVVQVISKIIPSIKTISSDEHIKTVTILAKPNEIEIARHIVGQLDKAKAEIIIYLELIEISKSNSAKIGLNPNDPISVLGINSNNGYGMGFSLVKDVAMSALLKKAASGVEVRMPPDVSMLYSIPGLRLELAKVNGEAKLLANPNVRVISDEIGSIEIGERISLVNTVINPDVKDRNSMITSHTPENVGVNITVKPIVHINVDITVDLDAKITSIKPTVNRAAGNPNISTRTIKTKARLRDGEQAIFAGFIKEEEVKSLYGIWGLSDIPILGKLFSYHHKDKEKIDIILSLRAVLVRAPDVQDADYASFDPYATSAVDKPFNPKPMINDSHNILDNTIKSQPFRSKLDVELVTSSSTTPPTDILIEAAMPGN